MPTSPTDSLADQLIDAQVRYVLDQLQGAPLDALLAGAVDDVLAIGAEVPLRDLVDAAALKAVVRRTLDTVPASAGASEVVSVATDVLVAGPKKPFPLGELVAPEQVEGLLDELLAQTPVLARALEHLTESPLIGVVATRFMGRIVSEVLATNQAIANKVPGLGRMVSLGTSAAGVVKGAADKQFAGLLGDAAGAGASFAVRRLNKILLETLADPTTREALLQVWELLSEEKVEGLGRFVAAEDATRIAEALQGVVATAAATGHVAGLVEAFIDAFLARYGAHPATALLDDLGITRDDLVADLRAATPQVLAAARADGRLEALVRARVEPFFRSPEVTALLEG